MAFAGAIPVPLRDGFAVYGELGPVAVLAELVVMVYLGVAEAILDPNVGVRPGRHERPVLLFAQSHQITDLVELLVFTGHEDADRQRPLHVRKASRRAERDAPDRLYRAQV